MEELFYEFETEMDIISIKAKNYLHIWKIGYVLAYILCSIVLLALLLKMQLSAWNIFLLFACFFLILFLIIFILLKWTVFKINNVLLENLTKKELQYLKKVDISKKRSKKLGEQARLLGMLIREFDKRNNEYLGKLRDKLNINTIEKIQIIRKKVYDKKQKEKIKYLNPAIIGTLLLTIWGILFQNDFFEDVNIMLVAVIGIVLSVLVSLIIGALKKAIQPFIDFFNIYDEHVGLNYFDKLLIDQIMLLEK